MKPKDQKSTPMQSPGIPRSKSHKPEWAKGLRQLYDSVIEEPLPDTFSDLLSKLDTGSK